jgi:hypothetical protein
MFPVCDVSLRRDVYEKQYDGRLAILSHVRIEKSALRFHELFSFVRGGYV